MAFRGSASAGSSAPGITCSVPKAAGTVQGDVMVVTISWPLADAVMLSVPSPFVLINAQVQGTAITHFTCRRVAEMKKRNRDVEARHREQQSKNRSLTFMEMDSNLSKARRAMREALDVAIRAGFEGEELELMERRYDALRVVFNLVGAALAGDSGTDWDAELAKLGE
jgi:hypothetical protein